MTMAMSRQNQFVAVFYTALIHSQQPMKCSVSGRKKRNEQRKDLVPLGKRNTKKPNKNII